MSPANSVSDNHRGYVIPIGGAEEKFHNPEILDRFIDLCGGKESRVGIIPTASELEDTGRNYEKLFRKLGIKPDTRVVLVKAPAEADALLAPLPDGAKLSRRLTGSSGFVLAFCRRVRDLDGLLARVKRVLDKDGMLWIAWPKKASGVVTDITEALVRRAGLDGGLVDVKICAIDGTWSGLKFVYRKKDR